MPKDLSTRLVKEDLRGDPPDAETLGRFRVLPDVEEDHGRPAGILFSSFCRIGAIILQGMHFFAPKSTIVTIPATGTSAAGEGARRYCEQE